MSETFSFILADNSVLCIMSDVPSSPVNGPEQDASCHDALDTTVAGVEGT